MKIDGKMTGAFYVNILRDNLQLRADKMGLGDQFTIFCNHTMTPSILQEFQRHTYLVEAGIKRLEWPAQCPDLNPIENL